MSGSVLCAVDISNGTDDIPTIQRAAKLADLDGVQLDVIAVVPDFGLSPVATFFSESHHEEMVNQAKVLLNNLVTQAIGPEANAKVRHVISTGRAYEEVIKTAEVSGASLIVVGAHKADLEDYLLGPNASRIVRHSECSVYVVRPES